MLKLDLYCCHECLNTTYASGLTKVCCKALSLMIASRFSHSYLRRSIPYSNLEKNIGKKNAKDTDSNIRLCFI